MSLTEHSDPSYRGASYLIILTESDSPSAVVSEVALEADKTWAKGDIRGRLQRKEEFSGVLFDSRLPESEPPTAHVSALLDRLRPHIEAIAAVSRRPEIDVVRIHIVEHTSRDNPEIWLDTAMVRMIGEMGAGIIFDCYVSGE